MSLLRGATWLAVCGACLVGCQDPNPYKRFNLGPAEKTVAGAVEAMGGLKAWQGLRQVRAVGMVTWHDPSGKTYTNSQEYWFDFAAGTLKATGRTPRGRWRAVVDEEGNLLERTGLDAAGVGSERTVATLVTILHRVAGPLNLLGKSERVAGAEALRVDGVAMTRVPVAGDTHRAAAYYFDGATSLLAMVTAGADRPGGEGTVTLYTYAKHPGGLAFPTRLRIIEIGRHVLVGATPVLEVEFSEVSLN